MVGLLSLKRGSMRASTDHASAWNLSTVFSESRSDQQRIGRGSFNQRGVPADIDTKDRIRRRSRSLLIRWDPQAAP